MTSNPDDMTEMEMEVTDSLRSPSGEDPETVEWQPGHYFVPPSNGNLDWLFDRQVRPLFKKNSIIYLIINYHGYLVAAII